MTLAELKMHNHREEASKVSKEEERIFKIFGFHFCFAGCSCPLHYT